MKGERTYDDPCGIARALGLIGERWTLLVIRELVFGPKRFTDLSRGLPAMSQNVLSQRLRELQRIGLVRQRKLGPPASIRVYELTELGAELKSVLVAIGRWGSRIPLDAAPTASDLSVDALVLALVTTFDAAIAGDLAVRCELRFDDDRFHAEIADGRFAVDRGDASRPDVIIDADSPTLRSVVFGGRSLEDAVATGDLRLNGSAELAGLLVRCFPRPTPALTLPRTPLAADRKEKKEHGLDT
ncbi:winged helix-turn-helix transcriptional regulator [Fodinicola feengrottensis]|uniref:Winged helix-turn-helix transcriptional regulator n=1 Tax=Fodinicola feengrottensis TaxID=435914 RepID=A0ABP4SN57_9ACTN